MYNPKFDYQPIPRVTIEGRRYYATPDGNNLPSVTTILDRTKPPEKVEALNQWRRRVGAEKAHHSLTQQYITLKERHFLRHLQVIGLEHLCLTIIYFQVMRSTLFLPKLQTTT